MPERPQTTPASVTKLLVRVQAGERAATDELFPLVYDELRALAARHLSMERAGHTLQPTALVNEAYLRLLGPVVTSWENRRHFFSAAATAIRRILIEHARAHGREKRGGGVRPEMIPDDAVGANGLDFDAIALDEALTRLAALDGQIAEVVMLRFFAGLSMEETANALQVSLSTAARDWRFARTWLHRELSKGS